MSAVPLSFLNTPNVRSADPGLTLEAALPPLPRPVLQAVPVARRSRRAAVLSAEEFTAQSLALIAAHRLR
jgi:hypothetical protein